MKQQSHQMEFNPYSFIQRILSRSLPKTAQLLLTSVLTLLLTGASYEITGQQSPTPAEWKAVEQAIGKAGAIQPGDVFKFSFPRSDLKVTARGVQIKPALALGSWVAFKKMGDQAMVMGDLVLLEDEINPVMLKLQQSGVEQSALHNHVLDESPRIMYMHISAHGDPVKIAQSIRAALALTKTPLSAPAGAAQPQDLGIDTKQLDQIIGFAGKANGGTYQFGVPRAEKITEHGMDIPPSMGLATAINFQPTGGGKAAITGDFVMTASEVNPVIRALRENGIEVTALHSHMLSEEPRLFFMHFWANDDAVKLARGLKAALDKTNSAKGEVR
ncbi:MAG TPA: DUF1259 domain-containing protein [Blastocatellia bacterium]|nr:DUF1259 domain-containing protein [Blastocatellia bacterium]